MLCLSCQERSEKSLLLCAGLLQNVTQFIYAVKSILVVLRIAIEAVYGRIIFSSSFTLLFHHECIRATFTLLFHHERIGATGR